MAYMDYMDLTVCWTDVELPYPMTSQLNGCPYFFVFLFWYFLHGFYGLHGLWCPLSQQKAIKINHSLIHLLSAVGRKAVKLNHSLWRQQRRGKTLPPLPLYYTDHRMQVWYCREQRNPSLHWRHNDHDGVSNHQPHGCLLNCLFRRRSKKTSKRRITGLCVGNSQGPVNSPHKGPVTRKMFPFDDVIMPSFQWKGSMRDWHIVSGPTRMSKESCQVQPPDGAWCYNISALTHWGRDKMAAIFQTTFSNWFSWMKMYELWLKYHWSLFFRF